MTPTVDVRVDESMGKVAFKWKVTNEGDEGARDVALDLPSMNESEPFASELPAGQSATVELTLPFEKLGIHGKGGYALFYRILYKDANFYSFSAPYTVSMLLPLIPSRVPSGALDGPSEIPLAASATRTATVLNVASAVVVVGRVSAVVRVELGVP